MDHPSCDQFPVRPSPFQARALDLLKKLTLRVRAGGKKQVLDAVSPVAIPSQDCHRRAHSSMDLFHKPDISRLVGFRVQQVPKPMDTDDSSQDASASSNSPHLRPRRHSTADSFHTAPIHPTFAGHGPASLFFCDQAGFGNVPVHDSGNVLAPAPLFLRSQASMPLDPDIHSPVSSAEISPQIRASPEPLPDEQRVQDVPDDVPTLAPSLTVQAPSEPGVLSSTLTLPVVENASFPKRPPLLPHHTSPLPPPFRVTTERGLRLSPSVVTRQPMPLLNLPALPPPPPAPDTLPRRKVPLRSMPSLSIHGHSNAQCPADHENATLEDSDEEDGDEGDEEEDPNETSSIHQSDDEDDEPPSAGIPGSKSLQKRRMRDNESLAESPIPPDSAEDDTMSNFPNYLSFEITHSPPPPLDGYPFSSSAHGANEAGGHHTSDLTGARLENKPNLHRVASRSMINLGSIRHNERGIRRVKSRETTRSDRTSNLGHTTDGREESEESDTDEVIGRLMRRTSMPSFRPTSEPPPYPIFDPRPKESRVVPHEDEGHEWLPAYSNALYLIAIMPRKMEFSAPGMQAKDRKWRRVVCELEGTAFRVYKCPPGASGGGVLGDWWEKRVGVGDVASPDPPRPRKKDEQPECSAKLEIDDCPTPTMQRGAVPGRSTSVPPGRQRRESQSSLATQRTTITTTPRRAKRASAASFLSPFRSSSLMRPDVSAGETLHPPESSEFEILAVDVQDSRSSSSHESASGSGQATPAARRQSQPAQPRSASRLTFFPVSTGRVQWRHDEVRKPHESDLLRAYTLQHAESGLGNDYLKRKNVIRVRLEGEQFLLQAPDVPSVVEWIEALHAGTNIALDIDQRPMPRGPMFPRRRRRRTRRIHVEEEGGAAG